LKYYRRLLWTPMWCPSTICPIDLIVFCSLLRARLVHLCDCRVQPANVPANHSHPGTSDPMTRQSCSPSRRKADKAGRCSPVAAGARRQMRGNREGLRELSRGITWRLGTRYQDVKSDEEKSRFRDLNDCCLPVGSVAVVLFL
jgi:hypothetical protein